MALLSRLRCSRCGAIDFSFRHPSGRPRCAVCGTFAHGPEVARWRRNRRLVAAALVGALLAIAVWAWLYFGR